MKPCREAEVKALNRLSIIRVDAIPPSVNTYVRHRRDGRHYKKAGVEDFAQMVGFACSRSNPVFGSQFEIEIEVIYANGMTSDVDNLPKVCVDSVARAGMLRNEKNGRPMSDSHVTRLEITKERGESPRTTIYLIGVE